MNERETAGEHQVPDQFWNLPHFQSWLQAQKRAGNRLDGFKPVMEFYVANGKVLLFWAAHVDVYVAAEGRNKSNEIVISRPDIKHVVLLNDSYFGEPYVVLVREFRSPATTPNGFILETPGGSSFKEETARQTAVTEVFEETGVQIDPRRLVPLGARQLMGTMSAHKAHVFAVKLTDEEFIGCCGRVGDPRGDVSSTERTYVETHNVRELFMSKDVDWSTLGMIAAAIEELS